MTVEELVESLKLAMAHGLNPGAIVKAWDADAEAIKPITGYLHGGSEVELLTDTQNE
jgi:hypothetical protein